MNKLAKLGMLSMTAFVLVACGGNDESNDNLPVDLGEVEGIEEDDDSEGLTSDFDYTESSEEESNTGEAGTYEEDVYEIAMESSEGSGMLGIGDSNEVSNVKFTLTGAEYVDELESHETGETVKILEVKYTIENQSQDSHHFGMEGVLYVDGFLANTIYDENSLGTVEPGRSAEGLYYFEVAPEAQDIMFQWTPMLSGTETIVDWEINL